MEYTVGSKIHINYLDDPYANYNGREGYIVKIDDIGQLHGTWGGLAVVPGVDSFQVIEEYTPLYYGTPCQVRWYNRDTHQYEGGIALRDELIKGDGTLLSLDSIVKNAILNGIDADDAVIELSWVDITKAIW